MLRICSKIKGQNLNCVIKNHNFIRDLQLADANFNGEANVDILIGADLYRQFVTGVWWLRRAIRV